MSQWFVPPIVVPNVSRIIAISVIGGIVMFCFVMVYGPFTIGSSEAVPAKPARLSVGADAHAIHTVLDSRRGKPTDVSVSCVDNHFQGCLVCWVEAHTVMCEEKMFPVETIPR